MPIIEEEAQTLACYLRIVADLITEWSSPKTGETKPWFRGQKRGEWSLVPGEYRIPIVNPDEIRAEFMLKGRELLPRDPSSDWEWYFLMQHYGLPTRLLDWTTGSLIGLHFALCHETGMHDAAVWALDPWALNEWARRNPDLVFSSDAAAHKYLPPVYSQRDLPARPIAIIPPYNSPRITVQRGAFTVHGSRKEGLEVLFKKRIAKITITKDSCIQMRRDLRYAGISEFTLFPDLDGLCRDIRSSEVEGC
jgi:hypothetical protein